MQIMIKFPKPVGDSHNFRDELPTTGLYAPRTTILEG